MATITSAAATTIPTFTSLKAAAAAAASAPSKPSCARVPKLCVKASLRNVGAAVVATAASAMLASNAMAVDILLGADDGSLAFVPQNSEVASGEKVQFLNNAGFPHNVIFDEDAVPSGVDVSKISMNEEDQGAGMVGSITVK